MLIVLRFGPSGVGGVMGTSLLLQMILLMGLVIRMEILLGKDWTVLL